MKIPGITATRKPPGEGKDLLYVDCITFKPQMALPVSYIYTLVQILSKVFISPQISVYSSIADFDKN